MKILRKLILPILFCSILVLASCNLFHPEPDYSITDEDEYELYNLLINRYDIITDTCFFHVYLDIERRGGVLHPDSPVVEIFPNFYRTHFHYFGSPADSEIAINFINNNDTTHYLDESRLDTPAVGFYHADFDAYWDRDSLPRGYAAYYEDFPRSRGIVSFSRPGFNADKTKAIMYYSHSYGMLGATGALGIFEKIEGKWVQVWSMYNWIS